MEQQIKVGFCVAYDWYLLKNALPSIYASADLICLSIDSDRISWSGHPFAFDDDAFRAFVAEIDVQRKIVVFEDRFCIEGLTPMQNEVRQRNLVAAFVGMDGWHIQLDCDEYFLDFEQFVRYLRSFSV